MKGLEINLVNMVILIIALAVITLIIIKLIPFFGTFVSNSLKEIKANLCKTFGFWLC